jgi:tetratricopeptide (TPR) repeat protein
VLGTHPLIKWTAVDGASGYTVSVRGSGVDWTSGEEVQDTQLAYPDDAPPLQPGETYKVVVQAGDASSDQEGVPGLGFTVLGADEAQAVRDAEGRIKALRLDPASESLVQAHLYESHKLYSEAEQTLSGVAANVKSPAVSRLLGDLYATTGLNRPAEEQYVRALGLSSEEGDIEGQALAQEKLGRVYSALGNKDQAAASLQQALDVYNRLGDTTMTEQINQELAEVK